MKDLESDIISKLPLKDSILPFFVSITSLTDDLIISSLSNSFINLKTNIKTIKTIAPSLSAILTSLEKNLEIIINIILTIPISSFSDSELSITSETESTSSLTALISPSEASSEAFPSGILPRQTTNGKNQCGFNALFQSLFAIPEFCAAAQSCSDPSPFIQLIKELHDAMFSTETSILDVGTKSSLLGEKQSFRKALASTLLEAQTDGNLKFKDMYSSLVLESTGRSTDVITDCIEGQQF